MPAYDYKCSSCGIIQEVRQKISDAPLTECPECGGEYKRIIRSVGIIFKGGGFHVNDYRSKSAPLAEPEKKSEPAPSKEATPKTPEKSAEASAPKTDSGGPSKRQDQVA